MLDTFCIFHVSLAALNASQFGPKYDIDHSSCTNMFLESEIKQKTQKVRFLLIYLILKVFFIRIFSLLCQEL